MRELTPSQRFVVKVATIRENKPRPMNFIVRRGYEIQQEKIIQVIERATLDEIQARNEKNGKANVFIPGNIDSYLDVESDLKLVRVIG